MKTFADVIKFYGNTVKTSERLTAAGFKCTVQTVCNYRDGREVPPKVCVFIEEDTKGEITRKDLHPLDWADIWPELVSAA